MPRLEDCAILKRYRDTGTRKIYEVLEIAIKDEKYVSKPWVALTLKEIKC